MNNYRNISTYFWSDSKVDDDFTPEDKYFYLYLLTNPHTNICGCYEISAKQMERETGYNADACHRLIDRMERVHNTIRYCKDTKEVLLLNWSKYNWTKSEKVVKAVISVANYIKNQKFKSYIINKIQNTETDTETETDTVTDVSIGYEYPIDTVSSKTCKKPCKISTPYDETAQAREEVPYKKIMDMFHSICKSYPTIRDINGDRKKAVSARYKANPDLNVFKTLFEKAEASSFLKGENDRKWKASFDWLMRPSKFDCVLEGKYDNKQQAESNSSYDADEIEALTLNKYRGL